MVSFLPFFSSIVTVSLAHFIKNLERHHQHRRGGLRALGSIGFSTSVRRERELGWSLPDELHLGWLSTILWSGRMLIWVRWLVGCLFVWGLELMLLSLRMAGQGISGTDGEAESSALHVGT